MTIILVIIALSLLILVHEAGHFFAAKMFGIKVTEFGIGFPPKLFSKKVGETEYSINLLPFGGFVRIFGEDEESIKEVDEKEKKRAFVNQKTWKKSVVILAGVIMNIFLAWILLSSVFMIGAESHLGVSNVSENSPAMLAGIEAGDMITEARAGEEALTDPISVEEFISFAEQNITEEINLSILRGEQAINVSLMGRENPPEGEGSIGIALVDAGFEEMGFFKAIIEGLNYTWQSLVLIFSSFVTLIVGLFTSSGAAENLTGPVGIFVIAKDAAGLGLIYLFQLTAIISLNLAILNLIPFPALDGGRFLVILAEKIKGSAISTKVQAGINTFGFILLLLLMIFVTIKDIGRFIL
ncbi:MAG: site-2 protease family protein [Candidatus Paceibacterota bacterium]